MDDPDFFKAGNSIADAIGEATKRLSSAQRTVLIGAAAAWIDKVVADEREACARICESIHCSGPNGAGIAADKIRKRSNAKIRGGEAVPLD